MTQIKLLQVAITYNCNKNCNYCFVENFKHSYKNMSLDDFKELLSWLEKNNIKSFNFTGGEPTIHPKIKDFIKIAHDRGFKFSIFTNGLFNEDLINDSKKVNSLLVNYNPKTHYTEKEYELLHKNLSKIKDKNVKTTIMFNITDDIKKCDHILNACKKYNIKDVLLDLIIPNSMKSNYFIDIADFQNKKTLLLKFLEQLKNKKIKARISRPMPKCLFTKEELIKLKKSNQVYHRCGTGESIVAINPDLTTFPCLSIFFKGPRITSFRNTQEYRQFYKKSMKNLRWQRILYEKCSSCIYKTRKQCQGACLCHKCKSFNIIKTDSFIINSQYKKEDIDDFIISIKNSIKELNKIFGKINKKLNICIFNNKDDLWAYSGVRYFPSWVGGFASSKLTYYQYKNKAHKRITHELAHLYIQHFSKSKLPTWLNEGFCEYLNFKEDNKEILKNLLKNKKLIHFKDLLDCGKMSLLKYDQDPLDINICYHQSRNFVKFLVDNFGMEKVMKLITDKYDNFYDHFLKVFEKDFFEIEKEWRNVIF